MQGLEYVAESIAKKRANAALRRKQGLGGQPVDVHERHPVKFGGSPTDPANKVILPRDDHRQVTKWWNKLKKDLDTNVGVVRPMVYSLTEGQLDPPADPGVVEALSSSLKVALPLDYLDFLRQHNGGEGFIGDNYIIFWKAEELADFNREYEVDKYAPGLVLFGSDGGGDGYGFDTRSAAMPIVCVPFIGMELRYATPVAKNFPDFLAQLAVPL